MAIVIAYKGTLDDPRHRDLLLEDMRRCAIRWGWPCQEISYPVCGIVVSQDPSSRRPPFVEEEVRGVQLVGPGAEPFVVCFNRKGEMMQYTEIPRQLLADPATRDTYYLESTPWVKTGQPGIHVLILLLLRRIKMRFMSDLKVEDDAGFWHTADYRVLNRLHGTGSQGVSLISGTAEASTAIGEDPEILLEPLDPGVRGSHVSSSKFRAVAQPNPA